MLSTLSFSPSAITYKALSTFNVTNIIRNVSLASGYKARWFKILQTTQFDIKMAPSETPLAVSHGNDVKAGIDSRVLLCTLKVGLDLRNSPKFITGVKRFKPIITYDI